MPVRLIHSHIEHHASHSGYDLLAKYVEGESYRPGPLFKAFYKLPKSVLSKWKAYHTPWYWDVAQPREFEMWGRMLLPRRALYHFFYAENDLRLASRMRLRWNNKVVATFHQPPEYLETHVEDKNYIRGLSAAIVVSRAQIPYMAQFVGHSRVFHVPHGVDVVHWCPDPTVDKWDAPTFLFVGFWLRDVEMFGATVRRMAEVEPRARFRVITFEKFREHFEDLPNTEILSSIPDEQLLEEYRRAWALFLPLKLATANNSILETMACGSAVVTTQSGGVVEYVDEQCARVVGQGDVDGAVDALREIAGDREHMLEMGRAGRRRAETFRWETVGAQMTYIYRRIQRRSCADLFRAGEPGAKRNICLLTEEYPPETGWGGIATYNYNLAQGLAQAGHRVIVIAGCVDRPSETYEDGVEVHRVKFEPRKGWRRSLWDKLIGPRIAKHDEFRKRLEFAIAARKRFRYLFDRIPIHVLEAPEYYGSARLIQRLRKRCPVIVKLHTPSEVNCWINSLPVTRDIELSNLLEKGSTKRAELVTAPSKKIIDIVRERWLPGFGEIAHLEYPIDTELYSPGENHRADGPPWFLFTGRLEHRKGVHLLVEAFDRVAAQVPEIELHLAGHDTPTFAVNGRSDMHFKEYMEHVELRDETRRRIKFLGRIPLRELIPLYRKAYACIIPSVSFENFPNSCLEAIACGRPVIVSDAGGMVEMAPHEVSGLEVKANDVDTLADAMRWMAEHPEQAEQFGRKAREIVLERYATDRIIDRTMQVYERVISRWSYR